MTLTNLQKEVFFGEHEEYENLSDEEMEKRLKEIFVKYANLLTLIFLTFTFSKFRIISPTSELHYDLTTAHCDYCCRVDRSGNNFITVDELEDWIIEKTNEHFEEAANENKAIFMSLDSDSNGTLQRSDRATVWYFLTFRHVFVNL